MKRIIALLIALFLCVGFCACRETNNTYIEDTPDYYEDLYESCHSTYEHKRALYSYDLNDDNYLSDYELELFAEAHPRFVLDEEFMAWVENMLD